MKKIWHFVLTGGPCGGKTTGMATLEKELLDRGFYVLIVPETATELIKNGIRPFGNSLENMDFQKILIEKQLHKEELYQKAAELIPNEKVVILYDRGLMDNKSYVTDEEFEELLKLFNTNEIEVKDRYDAVFHMVTAAKGAREYYTLENNQARTESPELACEMDDKLIRNWTGHPHLRIIDNSTEFEQKINKLLSEVFIVLGEPIPVEIERKYLVEMPNIEEISKIVPITIVNIVQTYLLSEDGRELRVRQRGVNGSYFYYLTEKTRITNLKRIETERKISPKEYIEFLNMADTSRKQIVKKRACFVYKNQYFELDMFNFSNDKAILEVELSHENEETILPNFIKVIKEVTEDNKYNNYNLSKTQML